MSEPILLADHCAPPFSLLRDRTALDRAFERHPHLILHAPPGSGKRTIALQWLYQRRHRFQWINWSAPDSPSAPTSSQPNFYSTGKASDFVSAFCVAARNRHIRCIVLEVDSVSFDSFPWRELSVCAEWQQGHIRLMLLTSHLPVTDLLLSSFSQLDFDTLAFSADEVESILHCTWQGAAPARLCGDLFTSTLGWPVAVMTAVRDLMLHNDGQMAGYAVRCRQVVAGLLKQFLPAPPLLATLALLQRLGTLPELVYGHNAPLAHQREALMLASNLGYARIGTDGNVMHRVRCSRFADLLLAHSAAPPIATDSIRFCAEWLFHNKEPQAAIDALLGIGDWNRVETLLLQSGDALIARFQVNEMAQWIQALDLACPIRNPLLLLKAIRCAVYRGDLRDVEASFTRILDVLEAQQTAELRADMAEPQWERFVAEVVLYSRMLKRGEAVCAQLAEAATEIWRGTDPWTLLRETCQAADSGDLNRAMPLLATGLVKSASMDSPSLYMVFATQYCWVLVLSGEMDAADRFLQQVKHWLMRNRIVFLGAYDWLDLLSVLLLRIKGQLADAEMRANELLQKHDVANDFLKHYLLISLLADLALVKGELYVARQAISKLGLLKQGTFTRSYWFAPVDVLHRTLRLIEEGEHLHVTTLLQIDTGSDIQTVSMQQQTEQLWDIKMLLHRRQHKDVLPRLELLSERCSRAGQWLRLLEIDLLRAVYFWRSGNKRKGETLFNLVTQQIASRNLQGILLDPFLLWQDFLHGDCNLPNRDQLLQLYLQVRPQEEIDREALKQAGLQVPLSRRERDVLKLLVQGLGNQAIADTLHVSITTIRTHVRNLYRKLDVYNRTGATIKALQLKLV